MDSQTFASSLPALHSLTDKISVKDFPDKFLIKAIAEKLRNTDESSPEYWPTVLQFLRFASAGASPDVPAPGTPPNITISNVIIDDGRGGLGYFPINASHCVARLEAASITGKLENCRVIFTAEPVRKRNMQFVNCAFEFPQSADPNPTIKKAARELLASNLTSIPSL